MIIHPNCWVTKLIAAHEHKSHADEGPEYIVASLRQRFWIIKSKALVKNIIKSCFECKKRNSRPLNPLMANLPPQRLAFGTPTFFNTGVNYFGPLLTKVGRSRQKRWGCLFTCMTTRAVHLEVADSLSTDSFINTLERFINRRGHPKEILSDCGSNFNGADNELRRCLKELDQAKIGTFAARKLICWRFNPPDAPHMGGAWESLVKTTKRAMKAILKNHCVTDFQLMTVLTEAESIVNSRPLVSSSDSVDDLEAITPNHFLLGRAHNNLSSTITYKTDLCSRKRWRQVQALSDCFWLRWKREYLPTLTQRNKWTKTVRNITVGDLVLVVDDTPRGVWKLGRVSSVFPGKDNVKRVAEVKTSAGNLVRPVSKLCLLEESQ